MHRGSWFAALLTLGVLLLVNLVCWSPGVGSGLRLPGNPPGTELESIPAGKLGDRDRRGSLVREH